MSTKKYSEFLDLPNFIIEKIFSNLLDDYENAFSSSRTPSEMGTVNTSHHETLKSEYNNILKFMNLNKRILSITTNCFTSPERALSIMNRNQMNEVNLRGGHFWSILMSIRRHTLFWVRNGLKMTKNGF